MEKGTALLLTLAIVALSFLAIFYIKPNSSKFTVLNNSPIDIPRLSKNGFRDFIANALHANNGPVVVNTTQGPKLVLPSALTEWVKTNKDLDHPQLVIDHFFADYPAFDGSMAIHAPDHLMINMIKTKLSKIEHVVSLLGPTLAQTLEDMWGGHREWQLIDWQGDTARLITRAAASVFVGPMLASNEEWLALTSTYVLTYFTAVGKLHRWPASLRRVVHLFSPEYRKCRRLIRRARVMIAEELERRLHSDTFHDDALEWTAQLADGQPVDHAAIQLGLGIAALFTTADALRQIMAQLCTHTEYIEVLREEINQSVAESGWTAAALFKMKRLDSFMKEAQRMAPHLISLDRKAVRDINLPDGSVIPRGTYVAVDSSAMWNSPRYSSPSEFDGNRYMDLRMSSGPAYAFTSSSRDHMTFGLGRSICPGRFLAEAVLKLSLAHILRSYNLRFSEGYVSSPFYDGTAGLADLTAKVETRRL